MPPTHAVLAAIWKRCFCGLARWVQVKHCQVYHASLCYSSEHLKCAGVASVLLIPQGADTPANQPAMYVMSCAP